jgi:hypothetical protein
MPKLNPFQSISQINDSNFNKEELDFLEEAAKEVLADPVHGKNSIRSLFDSVGLSLETTAEKMNEILNYSQDESTKYKVVQDLLKIHGALEKDADESKNISINFSFISSSGVSSDSNEKRLNVLIPRSN